MKLNSSLKVNSTILLVAGGLALLVGFLITMGNVQTIGMTPGLAFGLILVVTGFWLITLGAIASFLHEAAKETVKEVRAFADFDETN